MQHKSHCHWLNESEEWKGEGVGSTHHQAHLIFFYSSAVPISGPLRQLFCNFSHLILRFWQSVLNDAVDAQDEMKTGRWSHWWWWWWCWWKDVAIYTLLVSFGYFLLLLFCFMLKHNILNKSSNLPHASLAFNGWRGRNIFRPGWHKHKSKICYTFYGKNISAPAGEPVLLAHLL